MTPEGEVHGRWCRCGGEMCRYWVRVEDLPKVSFTAERIWLPPGSQVSWKRGTWA